MTTAPAPSLAHHPALREPWYHSIELQPSVWTPGAGHDNVAVTRQLLARAAVENQRCIDIGAQEGLVTALLARRAASEVVAYDRADRSPRLDLVADALGLDLDYLRGMPLNRLRAALREQGRPPADLVVFSGVLYHMFDPLGGLADVRSLVRDGGLVILETSAVVDDESAMLFNDAARFFPWSNYWQITLPCLDYLLRFLRLAPIDCAHIPAHSNDPGAPRLVRVAVACRAVDRFLPDADDCWMAADRAGADDYAEHIDWREVASSAPPVPYAAPASGLVTRPGTGTVDLLSTVRAAPPMTVRPDDVRLPLGLLR